MFRDSLATVKQRLKQKISIGTGDNKAMTKAMRAHANFAEYTPIGLLLMVMAELQGAPIWAVHFLGVLLVVGRFMHAYGFGHTPQIIPLRKYGTILTFSMLLLAAIANIGHAIF
ncbi:MAG: MAPEG family protein [Rhodobacterales bacterium]|nr:MAPEG family protein [Rhodobacterales bacterium]